MSKTTTIKISNHVRIGSIFMSIASGVLAPMAYVASTQAPTPTAGAVLAILGLWMALACVTFSAISCAK